MFQPSLEWASLISSDYNILLIKQDALHPPRIAAVVGLRMWQMFLLQSQNYAEMQSNPDRIKSHNDDSDSENSRINFYPQKLSHHLCTCNCSENSNFPTPAAPAELWVIFSTCLPHMLNFSHINLCNKQHCISNYIFFLSIPQYSTSTHG